MRDVHCAAAANNDDDDDHSPQMILEDDDDTTVNSVMNTDELLLLDVSMQSTDPDPSDLPSLMEQSRSSGVDPNFSSDAQYFQGIFSSPHQNDKQVKLNPNATISNKSIFMVKGQC
jgi:hypothetical protein